LVAGDATREILETLPEVGERVRERPAVEVRILIERVVDLLDEAEEVEAPPAL
jgi:hypothetical protein